MWTSTSYKSPPRSFLTTMPWTMLEPLDEEDVGESDVPSDASCRSMTAATSMLTSAPLKIACHIRSSSLVLRRGYRPALRRQPCMSEGRLDRGALELGELVLEQH